MLPASEYLMNEALLLSLAPERLSAMEHSDERAPTPVSILESSDHRLVYDPSIAHDGGGNFAVLGRIEDTRMVPWGFWGAVLLLGTFAGLVAFRGSTGLYTMSEHFWVLLAFMLGAGMYKLGAKTSLKTHRLLTIEVDRSMLVWEGKTKDAPSIVLPFEEVTELVFGMTSYPLAHNRRNIEIHAFTLLVRDSQDRLIPIIEASPNKEEAHMVAGALGQLLKQPLTYVGLGIK